MKPHELTATTAMLELRMRKAARHPTTLRNSTMVMPSTTRDVCKSGSKDD
jgi:hypothetical protein